MLRSLPMAADYADRVFNLRDGKLSVDEVDLAEVDPAYAPLPAGTPSTAGVPLTAGASSNDGAPPLPAGRR